MDLGLDYEDLGSRGKKANARELVAWMDRLGRLSDLIVAVKAARPHLADSTALLPPPHIPFHENKLFTGREEWLTQLHDAFSRDETVAVTQAVAGLGGVGKTQLALTYCFRHLTDYDLIHWLRADDATTLGTEMAELAYRLGLAVREITDQEALRQLALDWLHGTEHRWLLVFDNADTIQPAELRPYLPQMGHGVSLITSRNPNWHGLAQTLSLAQFSKGEAVAFLLNQPDLAGASEDKLAEWGDALQLAEMLGHLPLALEHARAYIAETGCSLADYAEYFATERQELWAEAEAPMAYDQRTITTTWELAFSQVRQTPGAAALLNLCCYLAAEDVPLTLITETAAALDAASLPAELVTLAKSKRKLDKAIAPLLRYSLAARQDNHLSLHRLVQTVARDQMPIATVQTWLAAAVELLNTAWPFAQYDMATWADSARLLPHLLAMLAAATRQRMATSMVAYLYGETGVYLRYIGNITAAKPFYEQALALDEKNFEPSHTRIAIRLNNLGQLLQALGDLDAARPFMEHALAIDEKALGPHHPSVAIDLNNLGRLLQALGDFDAARPFMERALQIKEKSLGPDHPSTILGRDNLALLLAEMEDNS
jgi:tetratricopeptide (TPR) repeat protein